MISDLKYPVFPALPTVFDFDNKNPDSLFCIQTLCHSV